jgi:hypothetical protein
MRFSLASVLAFAALAVAVPTTGGPTNVCNGGDAYCCNNSNGVLSPVKGGLVNIPIASLLSLQCVKIPILAIPIGQQWYVFTGSHLWRLSD